MTADQLEAPTGQASHEELRNQFVHARFEALAEWGIPTADALAIAKATGVDIREAVELLRRDCPSDLVLGVLG